MISDDDDFDIAGDQPGAFNKLDSKDHDDDLDIAAGHAVMSSSDHEAGRDEHQGGNQMSEFSDDSFKLGDSPAGSTPRKLSTGEQEFRIDGPAADNHDTGDVSKAEKDFLEKDEIDDRDDPNIGNLPSQECDDSVSSLSDSPPRNASMVWNKQTSS